jgi:hypothetical protein
MSKLYSFFIFPFIWLYAPECTVDFRPIAGEKDVRGNYTIELVLEKGDAGEFQLELYDLNDGKVVNTRNEYFTTGQRKKVFENVKPSAYTIVFSSPECSKKVIKGKGIVLE